MWDIEKTRRLIESKYGSDQLALARPSLQSVNDRLKYAQYHNSEVKKNFTEFKDKHLAKGETLLGLTEAGEKEFQSMVIKVGAHAVGCLQSIHSVGDIFSNSIYYSIGLNTLPGALDEYDINLKSVKGKLKSIPEFSYLVVQIESLVSSPEYKFLNAAANSSKHRRVVPPAFAEDWSDPEGKIYEVRFSEFTHSKTHYPSCPIEKTLSPVFNGFSRIIVDGGNLINAYLEIR